MPRPSQYAATEKRFGKPMNVILTRLLNRGGYKRAARWLHVHPITVLKWAKMARITTCYVSAEDACPPPPEHAER